MRRSFTLLIFVLLAGTHVNLTASEEQECDKIFAIIFQDEKKATLFYEKSLETEKFGLSHLGIIQTLKTVDPSLPTDQTSVAKLSLFLSDGLPDEERFFSGGGSNEITLWIEPTAPKKKLIKELAKKACTNKNQPTTNFPDDLVEIIYMYKQLIEKNNFYLYTIDRRR